jgi:hypothetical protein
MAETGVANPPRDFESDGFKLGMWVRTQRRNWESLTEDRRGRLSRLPGWMVDPLVEKWEKSFRLLEEYVSVHGNAQVPQALAIKGVPLVSGSGKQRDRWELLTEDQRRRLKQLPGWTLDARGVWSEEGFGHLQGRDQDRAARTWAATVPLIAAVTLLGCVHWPSGARGRHQHWV